MHACTRTHEMPPHPALFLASQVERSHWGDWENWEDWEDREDREDWEDWEDRGDLEDWGDWEDYQLSGGETHGV